jgi:hypothetical protein
MLQFADSKTRSSNSLIVYRHRYFNKGITQMKHAQLSDDSKEEIKITQKYDKAKVVE